MAEEHKENQMANNYCEGSSLLKISEDKISKAQEIIDRVAKELEEDEDFGYCGCQAEVQTHGVWFHDDESINTEHVEAIARALIEELEIDEPFYCSWAYTCSKPRIDEFGGGAFAIVRGKETYWVDAMSSVQEQVANGGLIDLEEK
ncbi:MAG: hypothetical protein ACTSWQ_03985 [Candidatus Thorarchaeota archaeon]